MESRKGEKIGWIAGWIGGFLWVFILAVIFLFQGKYLNGICGLILTSIAITIIFLYAPWRLPELPYWKLMIIPYVLFLFSIIWVIWSFEGLHEPGLNWWNFSWIIILLIPLCTLGKRKWNNTH